MNEADGTKQDALALFPEILRDYNSKNETRAIFIPPPPPPDVSGLSNGLLLTKQQNHDVPLALVLQGDNESDQTLLSVIRELGYQVQTAVNLSETIDKIQSNKFALLFLHVDFEGKPLEQSIIHRFINAMPLSRRRNIFYIVASPDFHTLYDIEALALSANLTVNDSDLQYIKRILRKSFSDHEKLYGPFLELLAADGYR